MPGRRSVEGQFGEVEQIGQIGQIGHFGDRAHFSEVGPFVGEEGKGGEVGERVVLLHGVDCRPPQL